MPNVDEDNWVYLGFCTSPNASQTQLLAQLYRLLMEKATFEEFWQARVSSTMVKLFQKHGLASNIHIMRNFESLMSAMGT
jgi:mannitol/fructose-specific phosphotransferase system IIA component (Ntr-type)